jgi:exonuclease SbcC
MIITGIKAENVLKYRSLKLSNLPEKGVIAISGKNESGKSTIGETVCFALFGRTFSLGSEELEKLVHWGSNDCSASLTFRAGTGNDHYHIERYLDKDGNHSAKFSRVGEEDMPIARGVENVADALYMILGYDYNEFIDSFYLAQREITAPQPHSHTVKAMAGVAALEVVNEQFDEEIAELDDILTMSQFRTSEIRDELDLLAIKDGFLKHLKDELELVGEAGKENSEKIDNLKQAVADYRDKLPDIQAQRAAIGRSSTLRFFLLLVALAFGGLWGGLTYYPDHTVALQVLEQITLQLPMWNEQHLMGAMYIGGGAAILMVLVQLGLFGKKSRLRELLKVAATLSDTLQDSHQRVVVLGDSVLDQKPAENEVEEDDDIIEDAIIEELEQIEREQSRSEDDDDEDDSSEQNFLGEAPVRPTDGEINISCDRVFNATMRISEIDDVSGREIDWTVYQNEQLQIQEKRLERAIYDEEQRLKRAAQLDDEKASLDEKVRDAKRRIAVRSLANELLGSASEHLSTQFNNDVRDLVSRTLPLFTEGRYEHLQIDNDMTVKVFSGEKRDFLDLEEVSSGTQRQIMLALRLALSQELVNRTVDDDQFVFLDEPFAFFDEARTRSSLKVLPHLSDEIKQIFVVGQEFPQENVSDFSMHLECSREVDII